MWLQRFRRDVLEGTLEEMVDMEAVSRANTTEAERVRRQAEFPGNPDQDNTKWVPPHVPRDTCPHVTVQNWRVRVQDRGVHPLLGQQQQRQGDDNIEDDDIDDSNDDDDDIEQVRAILNNKEFEQAVHQEICT